MIGEREIPESWDGPCPFCGKTGGQELFHTDKTRPYYRCDRCRVIYVPSPWHVSVEREKSRYDSHNNDPADGGYRKFLARIVPFMEESLPEGASRGLDFGCGPGPVLGDMLTEKGYRMALYDLFYRDDRSVLTRESYDFITSTEVFEHLADPAAQTDRLLDLLKPGGLLALMTRFYEEDMSFGSWFYKEDETHIIFFTRESWRIRGEEKGWDVHFRDKDMVIIKRRVSDNVRYEK
ncbi:MAG: class I SAM-dependent methyltransferase [Spirochaetales bacterium]|nr:class I SAM-dependent methyltransferase [Spirochaetales bacterium]